MAFVNGEIDGYVHAMCLMRLALMRKIGIEGVLKGVNGHGSTGE